MLTRVVAQSVPAPGGACRHTRTVPTPPPEAHTAYRLWCAAVGAAVLSSALSIPIIADLQQLRGHVPPGAPGPAVDLVGAGIGTLITAAIGGAVLFVAARMRDGRGWARSLLTVVGGVGVLVGLATVGETFAVLRLGVVGAAVGLLRLATLVLAAIAVVAVVRMPRPGAVDGPGARAR